MTHLEELHKASNQAWDDYRALLGRLPVYRNRYEQQALDEAYSRATWAKWNYDRAKGWAELEAMH